MHPSSFIFFFHPGSYHSLLCSGDTSVIAHSFNQQIHWVSTISKPLYKVVYSTSPRPTRLAWKLVTSTILVIFVSPAPYLTCNSSINSCWGKKTGEAFTRLFTHSCRSALNVPSVNGVPVALQMSHQCLWCSIAYLLHLTGSSLKAGAVACLLSFL